MHLVAVLSALSLGDVPAFPWDTARRRERDATAARSEENPGSHAMGRVCAPGGCRVLRSGIATEVPRRSSRPVQEKLRELSVKRQGRARKPIRGWATQLSDRPLSRDIDVEEPSCRSAAEDPIVLQPGRWTDRFVRNENRQTI